MICHYVHTDKWSSLDILDDYDFNEIQKYVNELAYFKSEEYLSVSKKILKECIKNGSWSELASKDKGMSSYSENIFAILR